MTQLMLNDAAKLAQAQAELEVLTQRLALERKSFNKRVQDAYGDGLRVGVVTSCISGGAILAVVALIYMVLLV